MIIRAATIPSPVELDSLIASEVERGRWTLPELEGAISLLGFGRTNALKVDLAESDEEFVLSAWRDAMTRAWKDQDGGVGRRKELTHALELVAEARGSRRLRAEAKDSKADLTPEKAYQTLVVPPDVEEAMLITVYNMRVRVFHRCACCGC